MKKNEIFENYIKIAQDQGLIANGESVEHTKKNTRNPRWDSLSIEQIGKLYGVKSDVPDDMSYDKNIIEDAHPDSLVISPSYDKLNGLVENENEGQNIRARIVMKEPDGQLVNRKYAKKQFVLSLVRTANDLDNCNEDDLRKLADLCLVQATQPIITKKAAIMLLVGLAASVLGAIYLKNHTRFHSDGFIMDFQKAMNEIDDLLNSSVNLGVGTTYRPEFIKILTELKDKLQQFNTAYTQLVPILDKMESPKDGKSLLEMASKPEVQDIAAQINKFRAQALNLYPYIKTVIQNFSNDAYKNRQVSDKGIFNKLVDAVPGLHGGAGLIADDFDDVVHALQTLLVDITNVMKSVQNSNNLEEKAKQELQQSASEAQQMFNPSEETKKEIPSEKVSEEVPWADLEKQISSGL